tara:strand:- start:300 stop:611 length:312 start_codon:yes stop_codon:yes gene_type:complete
VTRKEIVKLLIGTYTKRELSALMLGLDVAEEEVTDVLETEGISFFKEFIFCCLHEPSIVWQEYLKEHESKVAFGIPVLPLIKDGSDQHLLHGTSIIWEAEDET